MTFLKKIKWLPYQILNKSLQFIIILNASRTTPFNRTFIGNQSSSLAGQMLQTDRQTEDVPPYILCLS